MRRMPCVVVSFDATTAALRMEEAARRCGLEGRLIPIPRQLSAGCGMAWREPLGNERQLRDLLAGEAVEYEEITVMEL